MAKLSQAVLGVLVIACMSTGSLFAQTLRSTADDHVPPAQYQEELEKLDKNLRDHKWKSGLRSARRLTDTILGRSWYGKELGRMLSELALYQAVAEANLGKRDDAVWHWHVAQNLDFRMRRRDLSPYGEAGKLLQEFPLRARGEVPVGFVVPTTYPTGPRLDRPRRPKMRTVPTVLNNTGATIEGSGDFKVEVIIDQSGEFHQPVVVSSYLHPVVIYASLEWLRKWGPFEPALFEGEPADFLDEITVQFNVSRW